jgi:hypothetical protein
MRSILDEHGIEYVELEFIGDWFTNGERRAASDRWRSDLLHAAEILRAHHIKAGGDLTGQAWPIERMAREFRTLGRDANQAGT